MKKEFEIRRMLGENYHLSTEYGCYDDDYKIIKWVLFEKFDNPKVYFSDDNKAIMSSDTHTWEELEKFAKENRNYDFRDVMKTIVIIEEVLCGINIVGILLCFNNFVKGFIIGSIISIVFIDLIIFIMQDHNHKVKMKKLRRLFRDR